MRGGTRKISGRHAGYLYVPPSAAEHSASDIPLPSLGGLDLHGLYAGLSLAHGDDVT